MSLVICSNQISDGSAEGKRSSIYQAWSFRNQLSSTYEIPANAQVALQSVKVNVDGRIPISRQNNVFYQYFGKKLNLDGTTSPQIEDVPYYPLFTSFLETDEISNNVSEFTLSDFANRLTTRLNETIYHPNLQDKASVELLRNASGLDMLGYKITMDQNLNASNVNGSLTTAEQHLDNSLPRNGSGVFVYTAAQKKLTRNASLETPDGCSAIFPDNPLSLSEGNVVVNISRTHANVNTSGTQCPWIVGLSRYITNPTQDGFYEPYYSDSSRDDDLDLPESGFMDFGVGRNTFGELVCFQSAWDQTHNCIRRYEIEYWTNTNGSFTSARKDLDNGKYDKVRFTAKGEQLKVEIQNLDSGGKVMWETITSYFGGAAGDKNAQFGPIHQACWCLHPVLEIGRSSLNTSGTMNFTHIKTPPLKDYDVSKLNKSGWWETQELLSRDWRCRNLESRAILDISNTNKLYSQVGVNASGRITDLNNVFILEQSDIYKPTFMANARELLGFNSGVVDTPNSLNPSEFHSNFPPVLTSSQAMFVRLDNFNQRVVNALTGNKSQIIGHLPRFDSTQTTGRLFFEPKNFVWIDLDNTNKINVSDFNISFCYSNEQYAKILTGQSIVVLYFRKKPKELM